METTSLRTRELSEILGRLAERRPLFHSEADFQHALAWELQRSYPDAQVRLEVPLGALAGRGALDIVLRAASSRVAIEVKYFKGRLEHEIAGEVFRLAPTVARDISRYDACKDIARLEHAIGTGQADVGFFVLLCNDPGFWIDSSSKDSVDAAFKIHGERLLTGQLKWHERAGTGTTAKRESPICLADEYDLSWLEFSDLGKQCGRFRCLVVEVTKGQAKDWVAPKAPPKTADTPPKPRVSSVATRYEPLRRFFKDSTEPTIQMTLAEIERLVGSLPPSASNHAAWWHHVDSHPHAVWELEGYFASPKLSEGRVVFGRRS